MQLKNILEVQNLCVSYGGAEIVRNVSFSLKYGETLGIVGESGCGKSTLLRALMRLQSGKSSIGGKLTLSGRDLLALSKEEMRRLRGSDIVMIPQNALLSMDPTKTISSLFHETIKAHQSGVLRRESDRKAADMMKRLLLQEPERILKSYPFELSGGMCQRVSIALSMINNPKLLLGDEPTSALDVTSQLQVIEEMEALRNQFDVSQVIVSHNLGVISRLADLIAVMYAGSFVEFGTAEEILGRPLHPYTRALIQAVPDLDGNISAGIPGVPPVFSENMKGCPFAERCPRVKPNCFQIEQVEREVCPGHFVRCAQIAEAEENTNGPA